MRGDRVRVRDANLQSEQRKHHQKRRRDCKRAYVVEVETIRWWCTRGLDRYSHEYQQQVPHKGHAFGTNAGVMQLFCAEKTDRYGGAADNDSEETSNLDRR